VEVGCLECPRASTFGSQPQDWITPPWLAQCCNPARSPHVQETKKQAPVTLKKQWKEKGGKARWQLLSATLADRNSTHCQTYTTWMKQCTVAHGLKTDLWPRALLTLFVVNSFKLHLNTFIVVLALKTRILGLISFHNALFSMPILSNVFILFSFYFHFLFSFNFKLSLIVNIIIITVIILIWHSNMGKQALYML